MQRAKFVQGFPFAHIYLQHTGYHEFKLFLQFIFILWNPSMKAPPPPNKLTI